VLAHLLSRGREKKGSKTVFNSDIGCDMDGPSAGRARRSAAANTTFKMASSDKPLENCASKGPPSIPLEAAARGVTSAGSAGPHRAPLALTPCGWTDGLFSFLEARNYWFLTKDFKPRFQAEIFVPSKAL